jgi:hypothetical protein
MAKRRLLCWPVGGSAGKPYCRPRLQLPDAYCLISPRARRFVKAFIQYSLLAFVLFIIVLWLGVEFEERKVNQAPDTVYLYASPVVCGLTGARNLTNTSNLTLESFPDATTAVSANNNNSTLVAHCGDCGSCSNPHDVAIYDETRNSLFTDTVNCAKRAFLWGRKTASHCLQEAVGFTAPCNTCWVENIMCDLRYCVFVCTWHSIFSEVDSGGESKKLNRCTNCDEKRCGPAFVKCAGANRRRTGIVSDIERDSDLEVCTEVEKEWWTDTNLQLFWEEQQARDDGRTKEATAHKSRKQLR